MTSRFILTSMLAAATFSSVGQTVADTDGFQIEDVTDVFLTDNDTDSSLTEDDTEGLSVTGRFNGTDIDRLTVCPVESSLVVDEDGGQAYERMLIKSEAGTVPDLIVNRESDSLGFGFGEIRHDDLTIANLTGIFEKEGPVRDGLLVMIHPEGSTIGKDYTYLFIDGKWTVTPPLTPQYMTFGQCAAAWPETYAKLKVTGTWCKKFNGKRQTAAIALFPVSSGRYLIKMDTSGKEKSEEILDNEYGEIEASPVGVSTYPDWWSLGEELLLVEEEDRTAKLYRFVWDVPDGGFVNGIHTYNGGVWNEVGRAVRDAAVPEGWRVTRTDAEQLEYTYPWWE